MLPETKRKVKSVGSADIVVGIPSYNNDRTIAQVVETVSHGLTEFFPDSKAVIVNSDGSPNVKTKNAFMNCHVHQKRFSTGYDGVSGKGSALKTVFEVALALNAKAACVLDADLKYVQPWWIKRLLSPVIDKDYHFVAPLYKRDKYDGSITNHLTFPLTSCLYGVKLRQPIGGEFGFSSEMAAEFVESVNWKTKVGRFGIDIFMTTTALSEGYKVCQSALGPKIHDPSIRDPHDPIKSIGGMFKQVTGTMFSLMDFYEDNWTAKFSMRNARTLYQLPKEEPAHVTLYLSSLEKTVKRLFPKYKPYWKKVMSKESYKAASEWLIQRSFAAEDWARIVFDFAVAYNKSKNTAVLDAMMPLYFARVSTFIHQVEYETEENAEKAIAFQADEFLREKEYLIKRWYSSKAIGVLTTLAKPLTPLIPSKRELEISKKLIKKLGINKKIFSKVFKEK